MTNKLDEIKTALAMGYASSNNTRKPLDFDLIEDMAIEITALLDTEVAKAKSDMIKKMNNLAKNTDSLALASVWADFLANEAQKLAEVESNKEGVEVNDN